MASAQMTCPNCQTVLAVETEWAGMQITCPQCNTSVTVPAIQPQPGFQQGYQQGFQQPGFQPGFQQGYAEDVNMITALKKFAQFTGRSRRKEYWLFVLFNFLLGIVLNLISGLIGLSGVVELSIIWMILTWIINIVLFIPGLAVAIRRLHDIGKSGWNYLFVLIPIAGPIILLVFCCMDSQPGANEYGPNPKGY